MKTPFLAALLFFTAALSATTEAAKPPHWLTGDWQLNNELTTQFGSTKKKSGYFDGNSGSSVSVAGIPIPWPGAATAPAGSSSQIPDVLSCASMSIELVGEDVHLIYHRVGDETLKSGNDQGRRTSWSKSKLTSRYATSSRKVRKTFKLRSDGTLLVSVELNPTQGASVIHYRIFER